MGQNFWQGHGGMGGGNTERMCFPLAFSLPHVVANTFSFALWTNLLATMSNIILFYLNSFISYKLSCVGWKTDDSVVGVTFPFFKVSHQPLTLKDSRRSTSSVGCDT